MKKEYLGQPLWLWATGAVVVVGGYWWFTRRAATAGATGATDGQAPGHKSSSTATFKEWITQHQGGPKPKPKPKPPHRGPHPRPPRRRRRHHRG